MTMPEATGGAPAQALDQELAPASATTEADHALEVLLAVRAQVAPELPEALLRQCYAIQKQFQFDRDEQLPIVHTRRLVENFVEREASAFSGRSEDVR
jgi:hypothetical protein